MIFQFLLPIRRGSCFTLHNSHKSTLPFPRLVNNPDSSYANSGSSSMTMQSHDVVLYAIFADNDSYHVSFDMGKSKTAPPEPITIYEHETVVLPFDISLVESNYVFSGWSFQEYAYTADFQLEENTSFTMPNHDVTLYAVWRSNAAYTVSYDLNDGAGECPTDTRKYNTGDNVLLPFSPCI